MNLTELQAAQLEQGVCVLEVIAALLLERQPGDRYGEQIMLIAADLLDALPPGDMHGIAVREHGVELRRRLGPVAQS